MLMLVGVLLVALGLLSGAALVLASLGMQGIQAGLTLWLTFPLLCLAGYAFIGGNASREQVRTITLAISGLLLVLAVASIAALVLGAAGLVAAPGSTAALWYVLVVGVVFGSLGAASFARRPAAET